MSGAAAKGYGDAVGDEDGASGAMAEAGLSDCHGGETMGGLGS